MSYAPHSSLRSLRYASQTMNDSSFVEEPVESQEMPQQRRIFLITYSQADLNKFENCLSFSEAVVDAFGAQHIKEWACCMEPHQDGGYH